MPTGFDIKKYVKTALNEGHSERDIREYLKNRGYPLDLINKAFEKKLPMFNMPTRRVEMIIGIAVIGLILILVLIVNISGSKTCQEDICMIEAAQACKPASLLKDEVGSMVLYKVNDDCTHEKSISTFATDEPIEVVNLFKDKSMICSYQKDAFDETWLSSVVSGIDYCEGDLKDAIFELKLAQYELLSE